jgi:hypothetical protein
MGSECRRSSVVARAISVGHVGSHVVRKAIRVNRARPNNSMQRTPLHAAADAERYAAKVRSR